jgi:uncharacterized surface protein with fasciclin (FAS1) repeats
MKIRTHRAFALATALALGPATIAQADDDDRRFKRFRYGAFVSCAFTPKVEFDGTIVEAALESPDLETLALAVQVAGLVDELSGEGPFTVYAPVDAAFELLPAELLDFLLANPDDLAAVLALHVSPGQGDRRDPRRTYRPREIPTLLGQTVFYQRGSEGPQVNQSNVQCQGVQTTNGTVWLIDSVMLPQYTTP